MSSSERDYANSKTGIISPACGLPDTIALMALPSKNPRSRLLRWIFAIQALLLAGAVCVHLLSALPLQYSWTRTLELFWQSITDQYFIVMATGVLAAAMAVRRRNSKAPLHLAFDKRLALSFGLVLIVLSFLVTESWNYGTWDYLFLLPALLLAVPALRQRHPVKAVAGFAATVIALVIVSYVFTIFKSQLFVVRQPLDQLIVDAETFLFGRPLYLIVAEWARLNPSWVRFSDWVYFLFFHHMALTALFLFACDDNDEQWRYVLSLSLCYLLGGLSYFILPGLGPVYFDSSAFSYLTTYAKFTASVQDFLRISTNGAIHGQLKVIDTFAFIACMPSLHMAHETVMLFYSRRSLPMLLFATGFWISSFAAVLILGWHYLFDVLGGVLLALPIVMLVQKIRFQSDRQA